MTGPPRNLSALLLAACMAISSLAAAGARPAVDRPSFARPLAPIPLEARLRPDPGRWSHSVSEAAESSAANEGGFLGISGTGEESPSDTTGAGGAGFVVTAVNVSYAVWPRSTLTDPPAVVPPLVSGSLKSLFPSLPAGMFVFDPKVVYDPYSGRFVLAFLGAHGAPFTPGTQSAKILIASIPDATAADQSTWCMRQINADQIKKDGKQFGDYPGLGFDKTHVFVTSNQFSFGHTEEFNYTQILALGKAGLYNCDGKLRMTAFGGEETSNPNGTPAFTIQPAITESEAGLGETEYLANFQENTCGFLCGNKLTIWRVKKKGKGLDLASDQVNVAPGRMAPLGSQRDGSATCNPVEHCWDTGDLRLVTAFYDADRDRFYTAHAVRFDITPGDGYLESSIRWYEVDPSPIKRSKVTRSGIIGDSGRDVGWPSVATDSAGNLFVNYNRAGAPVPGEYLSAALATVPPGSSVPNANTVLVPGEALYVDQNGTPQRWGDFTAANRDPLDPLDIWTVNQYARSDGIPPTTNLWQQVVNKSSFV
ncbi:MAG: hypothetical protein ACRDH9_02095 [Actinomycetota bacterium]